MNVAMSKATSTSASFAAGALSSEEDAKGLGELTQAFHFSSGNPRIEETRGVMLLFREEFVVSNLPSERKPLVCVLGVPNYMTYADFCIFCGSFIHQILEMRIVRNDGVEDSYSALIRFDDQSSSDNFYRHFNGKCFSSLEAEICRVLFTIDVQFTGLIEHGQASPPSGSSAEQPSCPVCLEKLDQDTGGTLTTICNHSFHCSCISKWADSSCPVCRYCQQQPEKSVCLVCQTVENLWMCIICGHVGCGRYKGGHALRHWKETEHCYSLELETRRVWDFVGDNYVHRLIQSKTDGKLIELNRGNDFSAEESDLNEAILNSKVEAIVNEYNELLTLQLENQKQYFEALIKEVDDEVSVAVQKALCRDHPKLIKLQAKLDKCVEEKKFLDDINENLVRNQEMWHAKIAEYRERQEMNLILKDKKINELEAKLVNLMTCLETSPSSG